MLIQRIARKREVREKQLLDGGTISFVCLKCQREHYREDS